MPHTFASLRYHLVFSTKGRIPLITSRIREELYRYIGGIIREHHGLMMEIGGIEDHVHILASFRPRLSVSEMLKNIKGSSSSWINKRKLCDLPFAWQAGYAAFTVSESQVGSVRRYIRRQPQHHRKMSYQDELERLLQRHGIDCSKGDLGGDAECPSGRSARGAIVPRTSSTDLIHGPHPRIEIRGYLMAPHGVLGFRTLRTPRQGRDRIATGLNLWFLAAGLHPRTSSTIEIRGYLMAPHGVLGFRTLRAPRQGRDRIATGLNLWCSFLKARTIHGYYP